MLLLLKLIELWSLVCVFYSAFSSISFYVCDFVDTESVSSVDRGAVDLFAGLDRLLRVLILDERKADDIRRAREDRDTAYPSDLPLSLMGM